MPLRLILTRHAKSSWDNPAQDDIDRPLNPRGQAAALALGDWMVARGYTPGDVLCSPAVRTRETWAGIARSLPTADAAVHLVDALYHAAPATMQDVLRTAGADTVLMLGHNPGIAAFAASLPAVPPPDPDFARYPTGATLVLRFEADAWGEVAPGTGQVLDFTVPRRLT